MDRLAKKDAEHEVRFYAQFSNDLKVDRRFKIGDMLYLGTLEY